MREINVWLQFKSLSSVILLMDESVLDYEIRECTFEQYSSDLHTIVNMLVSVILIYLLLTFYATVWSPFSIQLDCLYIFIWEEETLLKIYGGTFAFMFSTN